MIRPLRAARPTRGRLRRCASRRGASGSSTGVISSVRSATAVACRSRFSRVGADRMPPFSWTARNAAAEIWKGMSRSISRGSTGWPVGSRIGRSESAGDARLGKRPAVGQQRVEHGADPSGVVLGSGVQHGGGECEHHVTLDADPHPAGVIDGQADAGAMRRLGGRGERTGSRGRRRSATGIAAATSDQRAAANPLRDHDATRTGERDVENLRDAGGVDVAQLQRPARGSPGAGRRAASRRDRRRSARPGGRWRCPARARTEGARGRRGRPEVGSGRPRWWHRDAG